jgi:hypothetical protein
MNVQVSTGSFPSASGEHATERQLSLLTLPARGWAWELLRRNPQYRADFLANNVEDASADRWGLLQFENPDKPSTEAHTFWRRDVSRDILPLVSMPMRCRTSVSTLSFADLQCNAVLRQRQEVDRQDIIFVDNGRALQVSVSGNIPLEEALLLTPALPAPRFGAQRLFAVKRFADLVKHGVLRPSLYPAERSARRLSLVLSALDGYLTGAHHREIAIRMFGAHQVERGWSDSGNHLRDRVRRAVRYGRDLMDGGYRRFLS